MKKIVLLTLSVVFIASGLAYVYSQREIHDNSISFGMMSGWAPFMSINAQGEFIGFDVDVAQHIAQRLGKKPKILDMGALASLFVALDTHKIDMILSGLDITEERLQKLNMIAYCGEKSDEYKLLFWDKIPENITKLEDLKTYTHPVIVVEPGVSAEKFLNGFDFIVKKPIASLVDRLLDLQYGKSLAMLVEPHIAKQLMQKNPLIKALSIPLPPEFQILGMGIAIKKDNNQLNIKIKNIIDAMKSDGTLKQLEQKWKLSENNHEV